MEDGKGNKVFKKTLTTSDHGIAHADFTLYGSDAPPGRYQKPQGVSMLLHVEAATEADRIFGTLAEKGTVLMPLQETFWALRFGELVDQFGTPWTINCGKGT